MEWTLYIAAGIIFVLLYFLVRLEWLYRCCEKLICDEGAKVYWEQYPKWERMYLRYFYIWRFASLKGKK